VSQRQQHVCITHMSVYAMKNFQNQSRHVAQPTLSCMFLLGSGTCRPVSPSVVTFMLKRVVQSCNVAHRCSDKNTPWLERLPLHSQSCASSKEDAQQICQRPKCFDAQLPVVQPQPLSECWSTSTTPSNHLNDPGQRGMNALVVCCPTTASLAEPVPRCKGHFVEITYSELVLHSWQSPSGRDTRLHASWHDS
jgi:hypothetical protein